MTLDVIKHAGNPTGARRMSLLAAINEKVARPGVDVEMRQFEDIHDDYRGNYHVFLDDLRWFEVQGWVWFEEGGGGITEVRVEAEGAETARTFKNAREDVAARAKQAREGYLRWLYDCYMTEDSSRSYDAFKSSKHSEYLGVAFSDPELRRAAQWLVDSELISGTRMNTGSYVRPEITNKGIAVIEEHGSLAQVPGATHTRITTVNLHDSPGSAVAIESENVTQSTTITMEQVQKANEFADSAKSLAQHLGLSDEQLVELVEVIDAVEVEASASAPKKNVMSELICKARDLAMLGTASGFVNAFGAMANTAISAIGG